jgi:hypothetical protein
MPVIARASLVALVAAALAGAVGGCAATSAAREAAPGSRAAVQHSDLATGGTTARHRQAVALANRILGDAPVLTGESPTTTVPTSLREPWDRPSARNLVTRARYWTVKLPQRQAYRRLVAASANNLTLELHSESGAGGAAEISYDLSDRPRWAQQADAIVEARQQSDGATTIVAFAQVVPYPARAAFEHVAVAHVSGTLRRTRYDVGSTTRRGHPTTVTLTPKRARKIAVLVNDMPVEPPWTCTGPLPSARFGITLESSGTTWLLRYPGPCADLHVTANGRSERALLPKATFWHLLNADIKADRSSRGTSP